MLTFSWILKLINVIYHGYDPTVRGDNPLALASELSHIQVQPTSVRDHVRILHGLFFHVVAQPCH